ncbi:MAG: glucuronate isomerase, partial [Kiritimatiellae bacterium]|nr:glucuronate isomerase [Kiritimatiellia bacterium]
LDASSAKRIYAKYNKVLAKKSMSVRGIIDKSKVKLICTTDDPVDTLEWHDKIAADKKCKVKVLPAFRPDKAFNVDKKPFANYIKSLEKVVGFKIAKFSDLLKALGERIEFFASKGCKVSDHGLDYAVYQEASQKELDAILAAGLKGKAIDIADGDKFRTAVLVYLAQEYAKRDWVMQLHYGCIRDNSSKMMEALGPDTGFDAVGDTRGAKALANLLDAFERKGTMPKVVLYSLNQNDNEIMGTVAGCFQTNGTFPQRIQIGSAWWFNDHKSGMEKQLKDLANLSALAGFVGMLTDSRSFLSYARHEYFRRILCNVIGKWVDNGEVIADFKTLGKIVQDISFNNTNNYFGFGVK